MAQQVWRLPLTSAGFPLLSEFAGRPVVIPNQDVAQQRQDEGWKFRPQLIYCENVLPFDNGLQSVGYKVNLAASAFLTPFDEVWELRDPAGAVALFSPAGGANYFSLWNTLTSVFNPWITNPTVPAAPVFASHAIVGGQSYVCYALTDVFKVNMATGVLASAALTGITPVLDIKGITSSGNYLIAWNDFTIFWSNPGNPVDFAPSLITGAGSAIPTELRGKIKVCYPVLNGFAIYTTESVLLAQYSGNALYPWVFKEIAGSSAIVDTESVTHDAGGIYNYALTYAGITRFNTQIAESVFPEVTDFLAARSTENYAAGVLTRVNNQPPARVKFTRIGTRYLVISYGSSTAVGMARIFDYALVYDLALNRWGKLKIPHVYCFNFPDVAMPTAVVNYAVPANGYIGGSIAFCGPTGAVSILVRDIGVNATTGAGVAVIGGMSVTRGTLHTLHEIAFNNQGTTPVLRAMPSMDGQTLQAPVTVPLIPSTGRYNSRVTALKHAVAFEGGFTLSEVEVTTVRFGQR